MRDRDREIPPLKGAEALRRLQGDVPLSCFRVRFFLAG
jgi:hypothetical protein